jgi:hypothetical protein
MVDTKAQVPMEHASMVWLLVHGCAARGPAGWLGSGGVQVAAERFADQF